MSRYKMLTPFGAKRGWELQRLVIDRRVLWRVTGRTWCYPAKTVEVALWRALPKEMTRAPGRMRE